MRPALRATLTLLLCSALPAAADEARWQSVTQGSELTFAARYEGEEIPGRFDRFEVRLKTNPSNSQPVSLSVEIDVGSIDMNDDEANQTLAEPDWFDSAAYPATRFDSDDIRRADQGYVAHGRLRIKGVERELVVPLDWSTDGDLGKLAGSAILSRLAWQVGVGEWASDSSLEDQVRVNFRIGMRRAE
jgi:polyisoprenoid-binding protein YceI